jgi:GcrA cell cycle regulator
MIWNDERIEVLKKLWAEGLSASQIACRIGGGCSRSAICGKVHRLGLASRSHTSRNGPNRPKRKPKVGGGVSPYVLDRDFETGSFSSEVTIKRRGRPAGPAPKKPTGTGNPAFRSLFKLDAEPYIDPVEELVIPLAERKTIATLEAEHCRWPIGDPKHADFHFCGKGKLPGLPYCEHHARRAYQLPGAKASKSSTDRPFSFGGQAPQNSQAPAKNETESV